MTPLAETLRDLVVSLSLDSDNFSRNLGSINKQIQEAESRFKAAGAGVSGFEKSAAGLGANSNFILFAVSALIASLLLTVVWKRFPVSDDAPRGPILAH